MQSEYDTQTVASSRTHIDALDGLRGLAICLVMVHHFAAEAGSQSKLTKIITRCLDFGWCGVDLFFVLSGFLITGILLKARGSAGALRVFYARRTVRIFPLYYLTLVGLVFIWPSISPSPEDFAVLQRNQAWYWTYTTNVLIALKIPMGTINAGHFWSLAVEEQFYMVWPFVVLFTSSRGLRWVCYCVIVGAFIFRCYSTFLLHESSMSYVLTLSRMDALGMGALVALAFREPARFEKIRAIAPYAGIGMSAVFLAVVMAQGGFRRGPLMLTVGLSVLAGLFSLLVAAAVDERCVLLRRILNSKVLRFFGKYSYAMYVFHPFIVVWMHSWFEKSVGTSWLSLGVIKFLAFSVVALALTSISALMSWFLWERWFLKLKERFNLKRQAAAESAVISVAKA